MKEVLTSKNDAAKMITAKIRGHVAVRTFVGIGLRAVFENILYLDRKRTENELWKNLAVFHAV